MFEAAILEVNHQIHRDACEILYSKRCFDNDKDIECIVSFFPGSNQHRLQLHQAYRHYGEWHMAFRSIVPHSSSDRVDLNVYGVRPTKAGRPLLKLMNLDGYSVFDLNEMGETAGWRQLVERAGGAEIY